MKKYRLKKWYPSLPQWMEIGDVARYIKMYECYFITNYTIQVSEVENNPDFWELIEEKGPLFVTEDGVEVYDIDFLVFAVKGDFLKIQIFALAFSQNKNDMKSFYHESNADTYIWKNKPVFSYNDVMEFINLRLYTKETIEYDAKERSKE